MKRNYYRTTPNAGLFSSPGRFFVAILGLLAFIVLIVRLAAPGAFTALTTPVWQAGTALTGAAAAAVPFESRAALLSDRERLTRENEALRNQNAALTARALDLQQLLGDRAEADDGVLAGVLARPPVSPYDVLIIDQGAEAGITVGDSVLGSGGIPIGIITEASAESARVTLFSEPGRVTPSWVGEARTPVQLVGAGAGAFDAELPNTADIMVGDTVFMSGPGALPIGTVAALITDPSSPTMKLRIRPSVNIFSIPWVTVVPSRL